MTYDDGDSGSSSRPQGGDVKGEKPIYVTQGEAIKVAAASYDPGYPLENTLSDGGVKISKADLIKGRCEYGKAIGEPDAF